METNILRDVVSTNCQLIYTQVTLISSYRRVEARDGGPDIKVRRLNYDCNLIQSQGRVTRVEGRAYEGRRREDRGKNGGAEIAHVFPQLFSLPEFLDCLYRSGEARGAYRSTLESEFKVAHLVSEAAPRTRAIPSHPSSRFAFTPALHARARRVPIAIDKKIWTKV